MEIRHYCNSFNSFTSGKSTIVCDPWVGEAARTSWISYPVHEKGGKLLNKINPDFLYISHLHCDHFDPKTLLDYKNKKTVIVIKKFDIPILKNRIIKLGYNNILECDPWKKYKLNKDLSVAIIPQMSSNNSGIEEQIDYDLDTSIVIQSNKTKEVFYNGVDNPLTAKDYLIVKNFISKNFNKKIAATVLQDGAAGEYPHCFLNINRQKERKKVVINGLKLLKERMKILKPEAYFSPSPGAIISGKFSKLNDLVAKPSLGQIKKYLKSEKSKLLNISGGGVAKKYNGKWIVEKPNFDFNQKKIIKKFSNKRYFYDFDVKKVNIKNLDQLFTESCVNYRNRLKKFPIKTSWNVEFSVYKNLSLNKSKKIDLKKSKMIKNYSIDYNTDKFKSKKNFSSLRCHLDLNLFYGLLTKKIKNWNEPTSGTLVLYERKPNRFDPNLLFSLNFLSA